MMLAAVLLAVPATMWWACLGFFLQHWILLAALCGVPVGAAAVLVTATAVLLGAAGHPRVLTPEAATRKVVSQLPEPAPLDFAWPVYFYEQCFLDVEEVARLTFRGVTRVWQFGSALVPAWPRPIQRVDSDDVRPARSRWTTWAIIGPFLAVPAAFLTGATAGAAAALALVIAVAGALGLTVFALCAVGVGLMAAWNKGWRRRFRAEAYCTRCFHRAEPPAYSCPGPHGDAPGAERLHRRLRPGVSGIWVRRCGCGVLLPTTPRRLMRSLTAVCPACEAPLHPDAGWSRDVRIAIFGGARTGKTAMIDSAVRAFTTAPAGPAVLDPLPAGPATATSVVTLRFPGRHRSSLVHLFDSRGEDLLDPRRRRKLTYLDDVTSMVLTIDPFSISGLRLALDQVPAPGRPIVQSAGDDPDDAYHAMVEALRFDGADRSRRLAVVVTKYDVLALLDRERMDPGSDAVREWLRQHGLGRIVFSAARDFRQVRYFRTGVGTPAGIEDPLAWILQEEGVTTGSRHD